TAAQVLRSARSLGSRRERPPRGKRRSTQLTTAGESRPKTKNARPRDRAFRRRVPGELLAALLHQILGRHLLGRLVHAHALGGDVHEHLLRLLLRELERRAARLGELLEVALGARAVFLLEVRLTALELGLVVVAPALDRLVERFDRLVPLGLVAIAHAE